MLTSVGRASGCAVKFIFVFILEDFAMKDWPHTFTLENSWLLKLPREPGQLSSKVFTSWPPEFGQRVQVTWQPAFASQLLDTHLR